MNDLMDILINLLTEFGLPEPDTNHALEAGEGRAVDLLLAWPDQKTAIRQGHSSAPVEVTDWLIYECHDERSARVALRAVGDRMNVEPNVLRLDFSRVKGLLDASQYEAAKEALDQLEGQIQADHPDWTTCGKYRRDIRLAAKKARPEHDVKKEQVIAPSFPIMVVKDADRVKPASDVPDFNVVGFFSPEDETLSSVDALWVAQVRSGKITVWTACLQGNPAYEADTNWQPVGTEAEMLDGLLDRLEGHTSFVWNTRGIMPLLQNWHYRTKGTGISGVQLVDLASIAELAFPLAHRTDMPESLCKQLDLGFRDEMGLGGPLAAMLMVIDAAAGKLRNYSDSHRTALRELLIFGSSNEKMPGAEFEQPAGVEFMGEIPPVWLNYFIPAGKANGVDGYLDELRERFEKLPAIIRKSEGRRDGPDREVLEFLRKEGYLAKATSFEYRERPEQIGFSQRLEECVSDSRPYVLEAGTGIGKTIGYLLPALLSGKRAFVSTNTKSLQDQAWTKDVPLVLKALSAAGVERNVAIMKGKGNYACLQTVADMLESSGEYLEKIEDRLFLAALLNWLMETDTAWLSEIEHLGRSRLIHLLSRDQAPPKLRDEWADIDPHARAKDAAGKADLILANHSYVFAMASAGDADKNDIETLVLDEAHNVEAVVTEVLTLHFRPWVLLHELQSLLKRDASGKPQGLFRALVMHPQLRENKQLEMFANGLVAYEDSLAAWCQSARKRLNDMFPRAEDCDPDYPSAFDLSDFWVDSLFEAAKELAKKMAALASAAHDLLENIGSVKGLPRRISGSLGSMEARLNDQAQALNDLFEKKADWVHWGEARFKLDVQGLPVVEDAITAWAVELHSTPLDIAEWLKEHVNKLYKHRAYVSATLTVGGNFDPICSRLGLDADEESKKPITGIYPSPFDYRKQALLAVPHDIPLANPALKIDPLYMEEQSKHIAEQAIGSGGRMLVLFTSTLIMREMGPRLQARLRDHGITVLTQADASRAALVDRLRDAPRKGEKIVLLGVRSFWEGIDIQGDALSVVIISKLPFEYHRHPVSEAKRTFYESKGHDRDYFRECVVPTVFLHLRQMYGRLIRSEKDRGATVVTDPRIYVRQYGKALLQSLPETTTVVDKGPVVVDAVARFLKGEEVKSSFVWGGLPTASYELSPEQRAIVECPSKRVLVRAAAGSGKTQVLITRLVRMVEAGHAKPEEVLAMTFTNKAVDVMYGRIESTLGSGKAYQMYNNVLTYHRLAMRIIRQDDRENGRETGFLDEKNPDLQKELFTLARQRAGLTDTSLNDEDALTLIGYAQNGLVNEAELEDQIPGMEKTQSLMAKFARFFLAYVSLLRERDLIDYGEAIVRAVRILREDRQQAVKWSNRFKWIFCDEYQDTSPAQATLLQLIGQQANLFVVGDNNQSIYSWQGSDPDNLRRFELDFPNTASFNLSKNYRCFPKLVRMSAGFLERAGESRGVRIQYDEKRSTDEQSVFFLHNEDDGKEAVELAGLLKAALGLEIPGDPPKKATVGVLARKWHLLEAIEIELIRQGVPYKFEGDTARGIVASQRVREIVRRAADLYEKSTRNHEFGDTAEERVGQSLVRGGFKTAAAFLEAVKNALPGEDLTGSDAAAFKRLCSILSEQPLASISRLFPGSENVSSVVLSTVHSQKGEEFDTVVVLGLEEGNAPHMQPKAHERLLEWRKIVQSLSHATWRAATNNAELQRVYEQEEKRIFYVAMTRARHNLVISRAVVRNLFGRSKSYSKSTFLGLCEDPKLVTETNDGRDLVLSLPVTAQKEAGGYRSDGRVYETDSGVRVRSKSELMLANEFTKLGIAFSYEEPSEGVADALPDFTFPEYGNAILEHLGMYDEAEYQVKWQEKSRRYEEKGVCFLQTNEEEMKNVSATVDRIRNQLRDWLCANRGQEQVAIVASKEQNRKTSKQEEAT